MVWSGGIEKSWSKQGACGRNLGHHVLSKGDVGPHDSLSTKIIFLQSTELGYLWLNAQTEYVFVSARKDGQCKGTGVSVKYSTSQLKGQISIC